MELQFWNNLIFHKKDPSFNITFLPFLSYLIQYSNLKPLKSGPLRMATTLGPCRHGQQRVEGSKSWLVKLQMVWELLQIQNSADAKQQCCQMICFKICPKKPEIAHLIAEIRRFVTYTYLILMQIFDFSRRFFSKMLIGFTLSSLDLLVLEISSGVYLKGLNPVIVVVY